MGICIWVWDHKSAYNKRNRKWNENVVIVFILLLGFYVHTYIL